MMGIKYGGFFFLFWRFKFVLELVKILIILMFFLWVVMCKVLYFLGIFLGLFILRLMFMFDLMVYFNNFLYLCKV